MLGSSFYALVIFLVLDHPFFGDCINLGSRYAHWFLESNFSGIIAPAGIDSGNPPFFGAYLALWWKFFGRSLAVAHVAMLPFLIGIVWSFYHIARYFFEGKWLWMSLALLLLEPTLLAQSTMLSPDIPLTFFFLMAVAGLLNNRPNMQMLGLCGLPLLSTRGIMTVAVVFLAECFLIFLDKNRKFSFSRIGKYIPAGLLAVGWMGYHYLNTGWISYNQESMPWAGGFATVGLVGYIKNVAILGWRILDFGRIFVWIVAGILLFFLFTKKLVLDRRFKILLALTLAPLLVFVPVLARYSGLLQHRYLLQAYLLVALCVLYGLQRMPSTKVAYPLFIFTLVGLLSGHFWIYPDKVAQGWDSSLAHVPYFELRDEMVQYIQAKNIAPTSVMTGTPNQFSYKETNTASSTWQFNHIDGADYENAPYIFYSNAFNDVPDDFYDVLHSQWTPVKSFERSRIRVTLFKNPRLQ